MSLAETIKEDKRNLTQDEIYDCMYTLSLSSKLQDIKGQGQCLQILTDSQRISKNQCFDFLLIKPEHRQLTRNQLQNRAMNNLMVPNGAYEDSYFLKIDLKLFMKVLEESLQI